MHHNVSYVFIIKLRGTHWDRFNVEESEDGDFSRLLCDSCRQWERGAVEEEESSGAISFSKNVFPLRLGFPKL